MTQESQRVQLAARCESANSRNSWPKTSLFGFALATDEQAMADAGEATITLNIKSTGGEKYSIQTKTSVLVEEFKEALEKKCNIPPAQQRLIYRGHVLKDNKTLASYGKS